MKLRIKGNAIRLRLQRSEIAALHESGKISATLGLGPDPDHHFSYGLESSESETIELRAGAGSLVIGVPVAWVATLAGTDRAGYDVQIASTRGATVRVVIEKDFQCLVQRPGEDDSDAFPNPKSGARDPKPDS